VRRKSRSWIGIISGSGKKAGVFWKKLNFIANDRSARGIEESRYPLAHKGAGLKKKEGGAHPMKAATKTVRAGRQARVRTNEKKRRLKRAGLERSLQGKGALLNSRDQLILPIRGGGRTSSTKESDVAGTSRDLRKKSSASPAQKELPR